MGRVLPLFTAAGERRWAPHWEPRILSGAEERGAVFRTRAHDGRETTWIVIDYRPDAGCVSYARLAEGSNMGLVDVSCTPCARGGTQVSVRYTLTGLNAAGAAFVQDFLTAERYADMIEEWRVRIGAALTDGK